MAVLANRKLMSQLGNQCIGVCVLRRQFLTRLAGSQIPCTNKEDLLVKLLNVIVLKRRLLVNQLPMASVNEGSTLFIPTIADSLQGFKKWN